MKNKITMIHKELLSEINSESPNIDKISELLKNGYKGPSFSLKKLLPFTSNYEKIGISGSTEDGNTVFHLLAKKGILGELIDTLFYYAKSILDREGINYGTANNQSKIEAAKLKMLSLLSITKNQIFSYLLEALERDDYKCVNCLIELANQKNCDFTLDDQAYDEIISKFNHNNSITEILDTLSKLLNKEKFATDSLNKDCQELIKAFSCPKKQINNLLSDNLIQQAKVACVKLSIDHINKSGKFDNINLSLSKILPKATNVFGKNAIKLFDDVIQNKLKIPLADIKGLETKEDEILHDNKTNNQGEKEVIIEEHSSVSNDNKEEDQLKSEFSGDLASINKYTISVDYTDIEMSGNSKHKLIKKGKKEHQKGIDNLDNDNHQKALEDLKRAIELYNFSLKKNSDGDLESLNHHIKDCLYSAIIGYGNAMIQYATTLYGDNRIEHLKLAIKEMKKITGDEDHSYEVELNSNLVIAQTNLAKQYINSKKYDYAITEFWDLVEHNFCDSNEYKLYIIFANYLKSKKDIDSKNELKSNVDLIKRINGNDLSCNNVFEWLTKIRDQYNEDAGAIHKYLCEIYSNDMEVSGDNHELDDY